MGIMMTFLELFFSDNEW